MYTEDKKLLRTAEHCKPYSPKKWNLISAAALQTACHWLRVNIHNLVRSSHLQELICLCTGVSI
jgi:hypothetical protein